MFRQVSLARLESPDQLDQILRVTDSKAWVGLAALFLLLATAVFWGFTGSIVTTAKGQGLIVRRGGVLNVVTNEAGLVNTVNVKVGDKIRANQVIATVSQPVLVDKMKTLQQSLAEAKREQDQMMETGKESVQLQLNALARQRDNTEREITELAEQAKLASEQITVQEQLFAKGLVTKQAAVQAQQKLVSIEDQSAAMKASLLQLDAQRFALESQPRRDNAQAHERISAMEKELEAVEQQLSLAQNVTSPYGGEVLELEVFPGSAVSSGQAIISIQPDSRNLELLAYIPSIEAKDTKVNMEVQISPTTIKREEFGFLKGQVMYASDFPATPAALMRNFENGLLVNSLTSSGPVNEVQVALDEDPTTPSGFRWSTSRSPDVKLTSGTLCTVEIVTRRQKPISWVFPYLKGKLGLS